MQKSTIYTLYFHYFWNCIKTIICWWWFKHQQFIFFPHCMKHLETITLDLAQPQASPIGPTVDPLAEIRSTSVAPSHPSTLVQAVARFVDVCCFPYCICCAWLNPIDVLSYFIYIIYAYIYIYRVSKSNKQLYIYIYMWCHTISGDAIWINMI